MARYFSAFFTGRSWITLGPGILFLILYLNPLGPFFKYPLIKQVFTLPEGNPLVLTGAFLLAVWTAIWVGYKLLNEELERRDAEHMKRSPRARIERAHYLLCGLIQEGKVLIEGQAHSDRIRAWDEQVRTALADWCDSNAQDLYEWNSRPSGREFIEAPAKGLEELTKIFNRLDICMKR